MISQVYLAAKVCVRGAILNDREKQLKTIANSVGRGHESLLEHTNLITILEIKDEEVSTKDMIELLETLKYLNYRVYYVEDKTFILISGSIRGYKHIFRNIVNLNNKLLFYIKESMYDTPKEFYKDFIDDNLLDANNFCQHTPIGGKLFINENDEVDTTISKDIDPELFEYGEFPRIVFYDNLGVLTEELSKLGLDIPLDDLLDFVKVTVAFKMSRTAANQLVRHRNAVSQESQRYVDYSTTPFINPLEESPKEDIGNGYHETRTRLDAIAKEAISEYAFLRRNFPYAIKEVARSILPANMETRVLMTFTFKSLIQAIVLRTHKAAQKEIREDFIKLEKDFNKLFFGTDEIDPKYNLRNFVWDNDRHCYRADATTNIEEITSIIGDTDIDAFKELTEEYIPSEEEVSEAVNHYKEELGFTPDYSRVKEIDNEINSDTEFRDI